MSLSVEKLLGIKLVGREKRRGGWRSSRSLRATVTQEKRLDLLGAWWHRFPWIECAIIMGSGRHQGAKTIRMTVVLRCMFDANHEKERSTETTLVVALNLQVNACLLHLLRLGRRRRRRRRRRQLRHHLLTQRKQGTRSCDIQRRELHPDLDPNPIAQLHRRQ